MKVLNWPSLLKHLGKELRNKQLSDECLFFSILAGWAATFVLHSIVHNTGWFQEWTFSLDLWKKKKSINKLMYCMKPREPCQNLCYETIPHTKRCGATSEHREGYVLTVNKFCFFLELFLPSTKHTFAREAFIFFPSNSAHSKRRCQMWTWKTKQTWQLFFPTYSWLSICCRTWL